MSDFTVRDLTSHTTQTVDGVLAPSAVGVVSEVNYQTSSDSLRIAAHTPDICVLTGSGNDTINATQASGNVAIDAGAGMNFIMGGSGPNHFSAEAAATATTDIISNFHAGDIFTLNGAFSLNWSVVSGNSTLTATEAGMAAVNITFMGIGSPSALFTAMGHGGAQLNVGIASTG